MKIRLVLLLVPFLGVSHPTTSMAQWQPDGVPLSTGPSDQGYPRIVSDGAGGAIVTWHDLRSGTNYDIYAQRISASGAVQWTADGVALCTAANDQGYPTLVSDGAGGAIVTWYDFRSGTNYDIYAQRISASGMVQWTADGVALCTAAGEQFDPAIVSDGVGGAIVTWHDSRSGASDDIYAQRINASGVVQWTANGVALCTAANNQYTPKIVTDGAGGAIVTWEDRRGANWDIYSQRISASGTVQWMADGAALCTAVADQFDPTIASDGAGGAVVTWWDYRSGTSYDIYAQRINASGAAQWAANGVALCTAANTQIYPMIVSDGAAGAIVTWQDARSGGSYDIYAQRINVLGAVQWTADGVALCIAANNQHDPRIASDGAGGAIATWTDFRSGTNGDIFTQRINALGAVQWTADGVALSTAADGQVIPTIAVDGAGGAIVTWNDYRSGAADIYAQRVEGVYGYWGHPEPIVTSVADIPNDQGGKVAVNWNASGRDRPVPPTIDFYSIWRAVDFAASDGVGGGAVAVTPIEAIGPETPPGVFTTFSTSSYYWELVGTQTAYRWENYSFSASTRADSVAGDPGTTFFMVAAHALVDEHIAFPSNVMSGHSVDNLAPAAPLSLTAQRVGAEVRLKWNRAVAPDLRDYAIYRAASSGVTPEPINFLASSDDTMLVDASAPTSALHYIVTAFDVHENESDPSNEASVSATTDVGDTPPLTALTVLQNRPNPFGGTTELEIGLPAVSDLSIEVYDVAGRRVRTLRLAQRKAGWQKIPFDGRNDAGQPLASGVYFYRVTANGTAVTNKMVIAR